MSGYPPAGPIESGKYRDRRLLTRHAPYDWARRTVNWQSPEGRKDLMLNVSRSTESARADVSIAIFFGDENDLTEPGAQLSESELRELLVAVGCEWAKETA